MPSTQCIDREEELYPPRLRDLGAWPNTLYLRGSLSLDAPLVAIVGARAATGVAMRLTEGLASELSANGHCVVSGGALGIDAAAHRGALRAGGYTLAVMACGLDSYYPARNRSLFEALLAQGGAMLSPFAPGVPPMRKHFVARNRVIAALADLVLVVEAQTRSGSLHTARSAARLGRKLAAVPGSSGCEALIARGVTPVRSCEDILDCLAGRTPSRAAAPALEPAERRLLSHLRTETPLPARDLAERCQLPLRQVQRSLLGLELKSLVLVLPGQRYLLSPLASASGPGEAHSGEPCGAKQK